MDHILSPHQGTYQELPRTPYFETQTHQYDGRGLHDFPERHGSHRRELSRVCSDASFTYQLALIQQWCFFGVLAEVFKVVELDCDLGDFVTTDRDCGERIVTTKLLPYYLGLWEQRSYRCSLDMHEYRANLINNLIDPCITFLDSLSLADLHSSQATPDLLLYSRSSSSTILRSTADLLCASLAVTLRTIVIANSQFFGSAYGRKVQTPRLLRELVLLAGWCLNEFYVLDQRSDVCELVFLSKLDRRSLKKDHTACRIENMLMLSDWNKERCLAHQLDPATYITKHTRDVCGCPLRLIGGKNAEGVVRILSHQQCPIIRSCLATDDADELFTVIPSGLESTSSWAARLKSFVWWCVQQAYATLNGMETTSWNKELANVPRYVAISHVWSDGLGNAHENALPVCQLQRLQKSVNNLYADEANVPFWIDTICVPHDTKWRGEAIRRMSRIYREADRVLVLDESLLGISRECSPEEILLRIKYSTWAQRLWTFSEGASASKLHFQFDGWSPTGFEIVRLYECKRNEDGWSDALLHHDFGVFLNQMEAEPGGLFTTHEQALLEPGLDPSETLKTQWTLAHDSSHAPTSDTPRLRRCSGTELFKSAFDAFRELRDSFKTIQQVENQVRYLVDPMRWRSTSRLEDETVCIYQLLRLDPIELLHKSKEERMKMLLSRFVRFPVDVLFGNRERFDIEGCRWMPTSFLQAGYELKLTSTQLGVVHPQGLIVDLPCARVYPHPQEHASGRPMIFLENHNEPDVWYAVLLRERRCSDWQPFGNNQDLLIVLEKLPADGDRRQAVSGSLAIITHEADGIPFARLEANLTLGLEARESHNPNPIWGSIEPFTVQKYCFG